MSAGTDESDLSELVAELCRLHDAGHLTDDEYTLASRAITDPASAPSDPDTPDPDTPDEAAASSRTAPDTTRPAARQPRRGALPIVGAALLAVAIAVSMAVISTSAADNTRTNGADPSTSAPMTFDPSSVSFDPSTVSSDPSSGSSDIVTAPLTNLAEPSPLPTAQVVIPVTTPTTAPATVAQPSPDPTSQTSPQTTDTSQTPPATTSTSRDVAVAATGDWQDSGVTVNPGDQVQITRTGSTWSPFPGYSYDGRGCIDTAVCSQDPNQAHNICCMAHGGLLGRIGSGAPFAVGNGTALTASSAGAVELRINDLQQGDDSGHLDVRVTRS